MELPFKKSPSTKPAPAEPSGDPRPKATASERSSQQQVYDQFLAQQAGNLYFNTRGLKNLIYGAASNGEIPPELKKWLFKELLDMANMVQEEV